MLDNAVSRAYNNFVARMAHPGVAQLVARLVRDQEAVGSNPATRTMKAAILTAEWLKLLLFICKQVGAIKRI